MDASNPFPSKYYSVNPAVRGVVYNVFPQQVRMAVFKMLFSKEYQRLQNRRSIEGRFSFKPFDEHKCIFVHIPKTGGTSVTRSLFGRPTGGHAAIWQYQLVFDNSDFDSYFKFAFVRNPWDRLLSAYDYLKRRGDRVMHKGWFSRNMAPYGDFGTFVKKFVNTKNIYSDAHILFIPQFEFICLNTSAPVVDFVGRFENLERDFNIIRTRLGLECQLKKINTGSTRDYRGFYTAETRQIVAETYRRDIELFQYDFDNAHQG